MRLVIDSGYFGGHEVVDLDSGICFGRFDIERAARLRLHQLIALAHAANARTADDLRRIDPGY